MTQELNRRTFVGAGLALAAVAGPVFAEDVLAPRLVFHDPAAPVLGSPNGDVSIVEFYDYQCPFCKKMNPDMIAEVRRDGHVRLVMKDWPIFGPVSVRASKLVLGASVLGHYRQAHDALMATPGRLTDGEVDRLLNRAGIDPKKAAAAYNSTSDKWSAYLARNMAQARAFGFRGTPSMVIGYALYDGALDRAAIRKAISDARAKAASKK